MEPISYLQGSADDVPDRANMMIRTLITFPRGFAFSVENVAHVFEKDTNYKFRKKNVITVEDEDAIGMKILYTNTVNFIFTDFVILVLNRFFELQ